ncbi:MAG: hypothetical protein B7Z31_10045 [Rhodobacterales bacterium 12-65-15]|nr:MAG: hypothetical protein B7Z31_10045 [Rhodobacterales bacterium 12-65-15]
MSGLDHLWSGERRASAGEMDAEKRAEVEFAACRERYRGGEDRMSSTVGTYAGLRVSATFAGPMDFRADDGEISTATEGVFAGAIRSASPA